MKRNRQNESKERKEKEKQKNVSDRMQKVHVKIGKTEMQRSKKVRIKKEEKKVVIDEETRDWNSYIGDISQVPGNAA
jgi:hypothetical protein